MFNALLNDVAQRLLSLNKREQKENLRKNLGELSLSQGNKCLDFGCGTGLFANVFINAGYRYCGYDIDERLTNYARILYRNSLCTFTASMEEVGNQAPFDLIMANCCFHHIDDAGIHRVLENINTLLKKDGTFLLIDILFAENDPSLLRNLFRKLERGAFIRKKENYREIIERSFKVIDSKVERLHLFSLKNIPVYNDLLTLFCKKK